MTNDETQIRQLVDERATALRHKDPKELVRAYAKEVVVFDLAPPLQQPSDARDTRPLEEWLSTFQGPITMEVRDLRISVGGDVAFCTSLNCLTATPQGADQPFHLWHRSTLGLRRIDGTWQIVHVHESVPFEMDGSTRASIDLQP